MIKVQSPTRFDLAGGTLDLWPIWSILGQATTINVAIDIWTHAELEEIKEGVVIQSDDFNKEWKFKKLQELFDSKDPDLLFYQAHLMHWNPKKGFRLKTKSDSPVGGGLGGSSSLSVSVYKAFMQWTGVQMESHDIVRHCSNIEAFILKTPTGTQDYYPAATAGGLNIIDYDFSGPRVQTLQNHKKDLAQRFMVVYTGKSHHSGINNWQVLKNYIDGDKNTAAALHKIADVAVDMKQVCLKGEWAQIPKLFDREFEARLMLAQSFMSDEIEKLQKLSQELGAEGFKICGAGGGGCVVVWTSPEKHKAIREGIEKRGFRVLNTQLA